MLTVPTSTLENFRTQILNPNIPFSGQQQEANIQKINKTIVLALPSDTTGCGFIACTQPLTYLNSQFGKSGNFNLMVSPTLVFQHDILMQTRTLFIQRAMNPALINHYKEYKNLQSKFGYKMVYTIDDWVFKAPNGETIPDYNFGKPGITDAVREACIEVMKLCDLITSPSKYLLEYITNELKINVPTKYIPNSVAQYFFGSKRKKPIAEKIQKPKFLYSGSPCHWHDGLKLYGDWEGAWFEWLIKAIKDDKITYTAMGGCPWFLNEVRNKIKVVEWKNSFEFHKPILDYKPDFMVGPLVTNYFNASKSDIKYIEACAVGALFIGDTFSDSQLKSPYEDCVVKIPNKKTVKDIEHLVEFYSYPENYNKAVKSQYDMMIRDGRYLESDKNIQNWTSIV